MKLRLINLFNHQLLANEVGQAYCFHKRLFGLMFTKSLKAGYGLHIKPCRSIHTYFMNYSIDVLYLTDENEVIACLEDFSPSKISKVISNASSVVELPSGTIARTSTEIGHKVQFEN